MSEVIYVEDFHYKDQVQKMKYKELGKTGLRVSHLALGGGPIGGIYETLKEEQAISMIQEAIRCGINYIDTAPWYGQGRSETILGKALKSIPRNAYYIGTKVGRYEQDIENMFDFSAERIRRSVEESLKLLDIDYVDVIQIHDLEFAESLDQILNETLPTLQKIVQEGKAKFIGITGYPLSDLKEVIERSTIKIDTVLSYSRCTLIDDELDKYIPYFKEKGIGVINAGLVAMGLLCSTGPQPWHPATDEIKEACRKARDYCQQTNTNLAALAIRYSMRTEGISTHLIGAGNFDVMKQNLKTATEEPPPEDLKLMEDLRERYFLSLSSKNWEGNDVTLEKVKQLRKKK